MKQKMKHHARDLKQDRAELVATAIRMHGTGASYRLIGDHLGVSAATVMRMLRDAPTRTVEAAVADAAEFSRDHARIVTERIDEVWQAQQAKLSEPASAAVALKAAALEAKTFLPALGTVEPVHPAWDVQIVDYDTGMITGLDGRVIVKGNGPTAVAAIAQ